MTPARTGRCRQCAATFTHSDGPGRRRKYCGAACRRAAQRPAKARPTPETPPAQSLARPIAEGLEELAGRLLQVHYAGAPLQQRLELIWQLGRDLEDYTAAAVCDERTHGTSWEDIAEAAQCGPGTARNRWRPTEVERQLTRRAATRPEDGVPGQTRIAPPVLPRRATTAQNRPAQAGSLGHLPGPAHQLASALSHLQRQSAKNLQELAQETGVSRPYVSRVLAGARVPSWPVARRLALACGGDPGDLRALWETARGIRMPTDLARTDAESTLRAALRGLYLSAAQPTAARIRALSYGTFNQQDLENLIRGSSLPDWETVKRFVSMLRGRPADIRPLWEAARAVAKPVTPRQDSTRASSIPAAAFG
nr:hypothetical protein C5F59_39565 [Streptomyces sp. QL37]